MQGIAGNSGQGCAAAPRAPRLISLLTAACLVMAVASQAGPMAGALRWFAGLVFSTGPEELRLRLNDWYREAVTVAEAVQAEVPPTRAVLVEDGAGLLWFVGLLLQPRRVFIDGPAIQERLTGAGVPFVVVHLERVDDRTWWWFEVDDPTGHPRRVGHPQPAVFRNGFEDGLDGWIAVGAPEGG